MGAFSRLRYVIAANVNSLIEKAEDPEKLLRALIREMEDASEEARLACGELLAEQQRLDRLETQLTEETAQWQGRAEKAVTQNRDDLARAALKAKAELAQRHHAVSDEQQRVKDRVAQMEADMVTLKTKLADAKVKLKGLGSGRHPHAVTAQAAENLTPSERKIRRAMGRFDRLQSQVDNLEARVRSYEVGGTVTTAWSESAAGTMDPVIEEELEQLKKRVAGAEPQATAAKVEEESVEPS
jgi:phage shock protein A